jgi:hypothetical protein
MAKTRQRLARAGKMQEKWLTRSARGIACLDPTGAAAGSRPPPCSRALARHLVFRFDHVLFGLGHGGGVLNFLERPSTFEGGG